MKRIVLKIFLLIACSSLLLIPILPTKASGACQFYCNDNPSISPDDFCGNFGAIPGKQAFDLPFFNDDGIEGDQGVCPGDPFKACGMGFVPVCCCLTSDTTPLPEGLEPLEDPGRLDEELSARFKIPELQVPIGTVNLTQVRCFVSPSGREVCEFPWIGQYIGGLYDYALGIGGILAAVVMMIGGVIWVVSAGDATRIKYSKDMITGSLIGLFLLFTSYLLLSQINPDLIHLKPITIGQIEAIEGDSSRPLTLNMLEISQTLKIECGQDTLPEIVRKTKGNVTYSQEKRGTKAPGNNMYFDCSSYASFVLRCAEINQSLPAWTGSIFSSRVPYNNDVLKIGDLVGWPPDNNYGHVYIYIGNGFFADAHGGTSGRRPGNAIGIGRTITGIQQAADRHNDGNLYILKN